MRHVVLMHASADGHVGRFHAVAAGKSAAMDVVGRRQLFEIVISLLSDKHPDVGLPGRVVILF